MDRQFIDVYILLGTAVWFAVMFNSGLYKAVKLWRKGIKRGAVLQILLAVAMLIFTVVVLLLVGKRASGTAYLATGIAYAALSAITWRYWKHDRSAFYAGVQMRNLWVTWALLVVAYHLAVTYSIGIGLLALLIALLAPVSMVVSTYRTYQEYGTVEKRYIRAVEISGREALVLDDPVFNLPLIHRGHVPFPRRFWRVAVMIPVVWAIVLALSNRQMTIPAMFTAGALLIPVGIDYSVRKHWNKGIISLVNAAVLIVIGFVVWFKGETASILVLWGLLAAVLTPTTIIILLWDAVTKRHV